MDDGAPPGSKVDISSSTSLKRALSSTHSIVRPPALKRRMRSPNECFSSSTDIRIFSWNVNGVGPLLQKSISFDSNSLFPLRAFLKRHSWPHLVCLQEVKINARDEVTQRRFQHAANAGVRTNESTYTAHFSLPRDNYNATGFGGKVHGVATLIRDDFVDKILSTSRPEWDLEGRVLVHELEQQLIVVNGYWVNGTSNPYRNTETGIEQGTRHDHKLQFHNHMLELSTAYEKSGKHVILIGDMNIARSEIDGHPNLRTSPVQHVKNRADFNAKFLEDENGMKGVDVFRALHGQTKKYTYHSRGRPWGESCDRVDLIIVSQKLYESKAITETNICDNPLDRGHSDHVPLWVAIDSVKILQTNRDEEKEEEQNQGTSSRACD